ncbi:F0F1 ATP synthase subunit epsilon [Spiribacter insolitus]|uniref:ATP synthase epsilon chain n=1 Tax=Spiribacter insolitus TaxID=3122417 RepID=A0ABV3T9P1_9GAMM
MTAASLHLRIFLPTGVLLDTETARVVAESTAGSFGVLPRHIDGVATLASGILCYGPSGYAAVDGGTLVKCGDEVRVSTPQAMLGDSLESLMSVVTERFRVRDEAERLTRSALARLEAGTLRRLQDMEGWPG